MRDGIMQIMINLLLEIIISINRVIFKMSDKTFIIRYKKLKEKSDLPVVFFIAINIFCKNDFLSFVPKFTLGSVHIKQK